MECFNTPCRKDSTTQEGMQKGANFCTTLPFFYHTLYWLNQQTLPKLRGQVVRKPFNAIPGLKVNRSINFSCIKLFFTASVLCSFSLVKLKTEGQTV